MTALVRRNIRRYLERRGFVIDRALRAFIEDPALQLSPNIDYVVAHRLLKKADPGDFTFIQIGALDGRYNDPIHRYVKAFGWRGVLVEPQGRHFEALKRTYEECPNLRFVRAAVDRERGARTLYSIRDTGDPVLPDWTPGIASFLLETVLSHRDEIPDIESRIHAEEVECITFDDLLAESGLGEIDLLLIDAEGYDLELLRMVDLERLRPAIVRFEHKHLSEVEHDAAVRLLARLGYKICKEAGDTTGYLAD